MKNKIKIDIKKLIMFIYPWRDSLGFYIGATPIRFGEIVLAFFIPKAFAGKNKIKKNEASILLILLCNLAIALLGVCLNSSKIDIYFAIKYLLRNVFYIFVIFGFLKSNYSFKEKDIDAFMNYVVKLEFVLLLLSELTGLHFVIGGIVGFDYIEKSGQYLMFGPLKIARFMGTAGEPGYLTPIILLVLYYYLNKYIMNRDKRQKSAIWNIILALLCVTFTFSTAVYTFTIVIVVITLIKNIGKNRTRKIIFFLLFLMVAAIPFVIKYVQTLYISIVNKILYFLGRSDVFDWSATDRQQHYKNAWKMFLNSSLFHKIVGNGTGAYLYSSKSNVELLMTDVDEAYNLFLSTLTDRGIIGVILLFFLLHYLHKKTISEDYYSKSLFAGVVIQYAYWTLTGNMWLYFFWINIILLIGYYRFRTHCHFPETKI